MTFWEEISRWFESEGKKFQELPFVTAAFSGGLSRSGYVTFLKDYYHFVKNAAPFYGAAASKIPTDFPRVRDWFFKSAYKEMGHDDFILRDLEFLGENPEKIKTSLPSPEMDALVGYNYYFMDKHHPVGVLGTAFVMGRLSTAYSLEAAEKIKTSLGLGDEGASFFFAHGHLDKEQPEDVGAVIESLADKKEIQQEILLNAKTEFMLYQNFFRTLTP